jgi:16S rRNA (adenine1518-N6/adenine1519-N6)-dimethyltransferase
MEYSPKKTQDAINYHNFKFKKKFGQNFIVDENIINKIINAAKIDKNTLVIEIGPGSGSLTHKLAVNSKKVIAYEIDTSLKPMLEENLKEDNIQIIYDDFLKRNLKEDLKNEIYDKLYVIANLPYYITTPIIIKLIEENIDVDKMLVMVQKEVGNRFKAKPNSKDYSSLSIFLSYYFDINKVMDVSKNVFIPKPNVDSIVVEFNKKKEKLLVKNEQLFFQLVRDSFKQKRKTIRNNLINYDLNIIEKTLNKFNYDLSIRAEATDINIFIEMANDLYDKQ